MRLLLVAALALPACTLSERTGTPDEPGPGPVDPSPDPEPEPEPPDGTARLLFETDVYPLLVGTCMACHDTKAGPQLGFVDPDPTLAYETILASFVVGDFSADAPIVQLERVPGHPPGFAGAELEAVLRWLDAERQGL